MGDAAEKLGKAARDYATLANTEPIERVVLVYDGDDSIWSPSSARRQSFDAFGAALKAEKDGDDFVLRATKIETRLSLLVWQADDAACPELPEKQTLERLVCASIHAVYPGRASAVSRWLASRPEPPAGQQFHHKAYAASHMAGWFCEAGYETFFEKVWSDAAISGALFDRLDKSGASRVLKAIIGPRPDAR